MLKEKFKYSYSKVSETNWMLVLLVTFSRSGFAHQWVSCWGKATFWLWEPKSWGKYVNFQQNGKVAEPANIFRILRWMVEISVTCPNPNPANERTRSVRSLESF